MPRIQASVGGFVFPVPPVKLSLPGDTIAVTPTGAYSTRKWRAAYAGFALNVRRSSDNTTQDIGFVSNFLDTVSMLSFVGASNGFITKWYDQSGNGNDVSQTTAANQPGIVSSGVILGINNNPAASNNVQGAGQSPVLQSAVGISSFITASAYTVLTILNQTTTGLPSNPEIDSTVVDDQSGFWFPIEGTSTTTLQGGHFDTANEIASLAASLNTNYVTTTKFGGGTISFYLNGGTPATQSAANVGSVTTALLGIGGRPVSINTSLFKGLYAEVAIFNSALSSANLNLIGPNMANYAGSTWSNVP